MQLLTRKRKEEGTYNLQESSCGVESMSYFAKGVYMSLDYKLFSGTMQLINNNQKS